MKKHVSTNFVMLVKRNPICSHGAINIESNMLYACASTSIK
jgi:hypothetical protein